MTAATREQTQHSRHSLDTAQRDSVLVIARDTRIIGGWDPRHIAYCVLCTSAIVALQTSSSMTQTGTDGMRLELLQDRANQPVKHRVFFIHQTLLVTARLH
jgi:hypothetical protein